jgi:hypothetical protein
MNRAKNRWRRLKAGFEAKQLTVPFESGSHIGLQAKFISYLIRKNKSIIQLCEISSSHGGKYDVQSCLLGYIAV